MSNLFADGVLDSAMSALQKGDLVIRGNEVMAASARSQGLWQNDRRSIGAVQDRRGQQDTFTVHLSQPADGGAHPAERVGDVD